MNEYNDTRHDIKQSNARTEQLFFQERVLALQWTFELACEILFKKKGSLCKRVLKDDANKGQLQSFY